MDLIFATANQNKLNEIRAVMPHGFNILSLNDISVSEDIPETSNTIEGNAIQKARYIYERFDKNCFADDTGLEVESLNNEPGVMSARYAGGQKNADDNIELLLRNLEDTENRKAQFKTVIALFIAGKLQLFEGVVNGLIIREKRGRNGFGYDPVFLPDGSEKTFAEMTMDEKNSNNHRVIAVQKMVYFLKSLHE